MFTLKVKKLGSLRDSAIEVKPFTVFFGENNLNKSYTLALIYLIGKILSGKIPYEFFKIERQYEVLAPYRNYSADELNNFINRTLEGLISPFFRYFFETEEPKDWSVEVKFPEGEYFLSDTYLESREGFKFPLQVLFLPSSRGVLISLENFFRSCGFDRIPGVYRDFIENWTLLKGIKSLENPTEEIFSKLFRFGYRVEKGEILVEDFKAERLLNLKSAGSSAKELAPLYLSALNGGKFLLIEEPEAHLHPLFQVYLAYFLVYLVQRKGFFITAVTHSDFFTLALGNLVKLSALKKKNPFEFGRFIKRYKLTEDFILNPKEFILYLFKRDGKKATIERIVPTMHGVPLKSFEKVTDTLLSMEEELRELLEL